MNESLPDSANLYVLGLLTADEQAAFEHELRANPALQREVHDLQEAALVLAQSAPQVPPPPDLRGKLLAAFEALPEAAAESPATPALVPFPLPAEPHRNGPPPGSSAKLLHFIPWAAAATMAVLFYQNRETISKARQETSAAQAETAGTAARAKHILEAVHVSEAARIQSEATLTEVRDRLAKAETSLASLGKERETLLAELTLLRNDSRLDKTRIAVLGSLLKNQPKAVAVSLWRQESQDGLLVVENMPALPPGRDYQLWVIDPNLKNPVSAGVFKVDAAGRVRVEFKPVRNVQSAYKFAVTVEKEGGVMEPTMDQMVVIGG